MDYNDYDDDSQQLIDYNNWVYAIEQTTIQYYSQENTLRTILHQLNGLSDKNLDKIIFEAEVIMRERKEFMNG